jgi:hypothetical protein
MDSYDKEIGDNPTYNRLFPGSHKKLFVLTQTKREGETVVQAYLPHGLN